jgi:bifunctional DNase/RNase
MMEAPIEGVPLDTDTIYRVVALEEVVYDLLQSSPTLRFREAEGTRSFAIPVSVADASSIASAMAERTSVRPTSAELLAMMLAEFGGDIIAVRFVRFEAGVYFAELDVMTPRGRRVFDCRPSDAVGVALRNHSNAPFLVDEDVLTQVAN